MNQSTPKTYNYRTREYIKRDPFTQECEKFIKKFYNDKSIKDMADELNVSMSRVRTFMRSNNLSMTPARIQEVRLAKLKTQKVTR